MNKPPYEIEIAKTGTATATNGAKVNFTERMLDDVAGSYNPTLFQAPLIITHNTRGVPDSELANSPLAYGRPDYLRREGDRLKAVFNQKIDPTVVQWFRQGNLLGVSPSFYPPNHPHNPTPGKYHLRHIAALGKEPPSMKGLAPVCFGEGDDGADALDFMLPPSAALDFSCACESGGTAINLLEDLREYLIAEKGLAEANTLIPRAAIESARRELQYAQEAVATLAAIQEQEAMVEEELEEAEDEYADPYPIYSYQESPTPKKAMQTTKSKTKKAKSHGADDEEMMLLNDPLNEDASVLDEMDEYDRFDELEEEDEEEEEAPKAKSKTKSKAKSQDYSEVSRSLRAEMERRLRSIEADFSEKLQGLEEEMEAQSADFAEQREALERELAERHLQTLAQQCEVEAKLLEFEEAREQTRLENISSFVDELVEEGVYPHLLGELSLEYAETDECAPVVWELTDFLASLNDTQLEFAETFIRGFASALGEAQSVVNYSEQSSAVIDTPPAKSPVDALGVRVPTGAGVSPQAQAEAEMLMDFAESHGFDLTDKNQFKQAYKLLRKGGN